MLGVPGEHGDVAGLRPALGADEVDRAEQAARLADRLGEPGKRAGPVLEADAQGRAERGGRMAAVTALPRSAARRGRRARGAPGSRASTATRQPRSAASAAAAASASQPGLGVDDGVDDDLGEAEPPVVALGDVAARADLEAAQRDVAPLGDGEERHGEARGDGADEQVLGAPDALDAALELGRSRNLEVVLAVDGRDGSPPGEPAEPRAGSRRPSAVVVMAIPPWSSSSSTVSSRTPCAPGAVGSVSSSACTSAPSASGAGGGILEVLAEVSGGEVGERAEPDADPGDAGAALVGGERLELPDEILGQMLLVQ